jgi:hypothetical protein
LWNEAEVKNDARAAADLKAIEWHQFDVSPHDGVFPDNSAVRRREDCQIGGVSALPLPVQV